MIKRIYIAIILVFIAQISISKSISNEMYELNKEEEKKKKKKRKKNAKPSLNATFVFDEPKKSTGADLNATESGENNVDALDNKEHVEPETTDRSTTWGLNNINATTESAESNLSDYHVAQKGESIYTIARKYNISVANLILLNKLSSTGINEGQKIVLKGNTTSTAGKVAVVSQEVTTAIEKTETKPQQKESTQNRISSQTVLIGCYAVVNESDAIVLTNRLKEKGYDSGYFYIPNYEEEGKKMYRVFTGPYPDQKSARVILAEIQKFREKAYIFKVR
jgi:LysM repeat protein